MTFKGFDDILEARLCTFYRNDGYDFWLWELRVNAVLRGKNLVDPLTNKEEQMKSSERELAVIESTLGDNPFRAIQDCETAIVAWERHQSWDAGKSMINRLMVLNIFPNIRLRSNNEMVDHVTQLKSQLLRLAAMGSVIEERMKIAVLLSALNNQRERSPTIGSVHMIQHEMATWSYVINIFLERNRRLKNRWIVSSQEIVGHLAMTWAEKEWPSQRNYIRRIQGLTFYICRKDGR